MPVRRKPDGTWEFDTVSEAVDFEQRAVARASVAPVAPQSRVRTRSGRPGLQPASSPANEESRDDADRALLILAHAGAKGVEGKELAAKLGIKNPKALSGVSQAIRKRITGAANGTPPDKLFRIERRPRRPTRWIGDAQKLREIGLVE